jgi:hypothetical protein
MLQAALAQHVEHRVGREGALNKTACCEPLEGDQLSARNEIGQICCKEPSLGLLDVHSSSRSVVSGVIVHRKTISACPQGPRAVYSLVLCARDDYIQQAL